MTTLVLIAMAGGAAWYGHATAAALMPESAMSSVQASAKDVQSGTRILLELARDAMRDGHLVAPQGSNAYEFYLSVLQLEPDNRIAQEALREAFPYATVEIERTINRKDVEEARREIDLLREIDRTNYTLVLLVAKLGAQQQLLAQRHRAQAALIQRATSTRAAGG